MSETEHPKAERVGHMLGRFVGHAMFATVAGFGLGAIGSIGWMALRAGYALPIRAVTYVVTSFNGWFD